MFSALWDRDRIKMNKIPQIPPKSSKKECNKSYRTHWSKWGRERGTPVYNAHPTWLPAVCFPCIHLLTRRGIPPNRFPSSTRLPFPLFPPPGWESVSSTKEVLLMEMRRGMKQVSRILTLLSSKPYCVWPTAGGGVKAAWRSYELEKERKNKTKTIPTLSFLKPQEKPRAGTGSSGDTAQLGDDGRWPPRQS